MHPLLSIVLALASIVVSTPAFADQVDDFINGQLRTQRIPGLALAVIKDGEVVKAAGYGVADRVTKAPVTAETVFRIGSISKPILATATMRLVQDGRLDLDAPVRTYLRDAPPAWDGITVRHLLGHSAGLPRDADDFDPLKPQPSSAQLLASAYRQPLRSKPGEIVAYSNMGYAMLAEVITAAAGRPWSAYVEEQVLKPAGMTATHLYTRTDAPNRANGYSDNDKLLPAVEWVAVPASGSYQSTVLDLANWDRALSGDAILTEETRRQMWTPMVLGDGTRSPTGLGWGLGPFAGRRRISHSGGLPGFSSLYWRFPDERLSIVVLINLDDADISSILAGVAALYFK
jgi:D-alanyl-D-alanine carboxypeptidase